MAGLARDLSQDDMAPMRKEDMIRLLIHTLPGDLLFLLVIFSYFLFLQILRNRFFVALQAGGYSG